MTKKINSRIVHKHDTEANWLRAVDFVPQQGELIVYDIDDKYTYERFKIGDGVKSVGNLPFAIDVNTQIPVATSSDGVAYAVTAPGITTLRVGTSVTVIPVKANTDTAPTLNVNNLGAKTIKRRQSDSSNPVSVKTNILKGGAPVRLTYDGAYWILEGALQVSASDISGTVDWASKAILDPNGNPLMGYVKEVTEVDGVINIKQGNGNTSTIDIGKKVEVLEVPSLERIMHTSDYTEASNNYMWLLCNKIIAAEEAGKLVMIIEYGHTGAWYNLSYRRDNGTTIDNGAYDKFLFTGLNPSFISTGVDGAYSWPTYFRTIEFDYLNKKILFETDMQNIADPGDWIESWTDLEDAYDLGIPSYHAIWKMCQSVLEDAKAYTREYVGAIPNAEEGSF